MKKPIVFVIAVIICLLNPFGAFPASWEAVAGFVQNNDDLVSSAKQADSAKWSYNKSWTNYFPHVSLSGSYSELTDSGTDEIAKSYSTGVSVTQTLFSGFANYNALRSAYANYQMALSSYNKTLSDAYNNVRIAFIELYIAEANLDLSRQILAVLKQNTRMIKLRYESGSEDRGNLLATQAFERNGEFSVSSAKRQLESARIKLSQLVSEEISATDGSLNITYEAEPDFQKLTDASPSYIIAKFTLELADIADQDTMAEFLPTAQLAWQNRSSGSEWPTTDTSSSWSINLSYSILPGGANIADKIINDINLEKARRDLESTRKSVYLNIYDSYRALKDATENLEVSRVSMQANDERAKIANARYNNGLMSFDEWNRIIADDISSQKSNLQAKKNAFEASSQWKNSYGGWEK